MTDIRLSIPPRLLAPLTAVVKLLAEQDSKSYLVGGVVRDMLLKRVTTDIDIAISGDALETAARVATGLGGKCVLLDEINRVGRVVKADDNDHWQFDFSTFSGNIEPDLARRDFTIDAMAADLGELTTGPVQLQLIDPLGGWDDIQHHLIRAVTETTFESDAVRLLRALRLAAELDFSIDSQTENLIRRSAHLVSSVAGERIREELLKLLAVPETKRFLRYLDELGLLTVLIPELAETKGVTQPPEHFWDVFNHTLETVAAVDFLLRKGAWEYAADNFLTTVPWSPMLTEHFDKEVNYGSTRRLILKMAALLHDVAKPITKTIDADGHTRFLGHPQQGAEVAANIMERLRFSSREVNLVSVMVQNHLRPSQMSQDGLPSARAIYRYFRDTEDASVDILFLSLADHLATRGPHLRLAGWQEHVQVVEHVLSQRSQKTVASPPKLVDGHDLINIFGISPGPKIGELLEAVHEAQAAGELTTREETLSYIRDHLLTRHK